MKSSIVLDMDGSLSDRPCARRIHCGNWYDKLQFRCDEQTLRSFATQLDRQLPARHGPILTGGVGLHHLSVPMIARQPHSGLRVVVFDLQPDNMRFPFGLHCHSWLKQALALPNVACIYVVGLTSPALGKATIWNHRTAPLRSGKLHYWLIGNNPDWPDWLIGTHTLRAFDTPDNLTDALFTLACSERRNTYLSIDHSALSPPLIAPDHYDGKLKTHHVTFIIDAMARQVVGADITGAPKRYHHPFRWPGLRAPDPRVCPVQHHAAQQRCNDSLLERLAFAM